MGEKHTIFYPDCPDSAVLRFFSGGGLLVLTRSLSVSETFLPGQEIFVTREIRLIHFGSIRDRLDYFITFSTGNSVGTERNRPCLY